MRRSRAHAFSLPEMTVSTAAMTLILGALLLSSLSVQKALHGSEAYANSYSDQRRLIDYFGRDLRRAVALSATDAAGNPLSLAGQTVDIAGLSTLTLTLPGYYKSNTPGTLGFDDTLEVVPNQAGPTYGDNAGPAPTLPVTFRKMFRASEDCVCFLRKEGDTEQIIVRKAENLHVHVTIAEDGRTGFIQSWYRAPYTTKPLVSTYDHLMLRNVRLD